MKLGDIYRYSGLLYGVNLVTSFVTFLVMILVSRAITKEELGMYGLFQAYFLLGAALSGFGVSQSVVKFVAERAIDKRQIHTLIAGILAAMAAVLIGGGFIAVRLGYEILGLAVMTLPAYHLFDFALAYARAHLWKGVESSILVASSLANSLFIVVLVYLFPDHRGPVYGQVLSTYAVAAVLIAMFVRASGRGDARFERIRGPWTRDFALVAGPLFVSAILFAVNDVADRFIVERYLGLELLGEYFLAMTLFGILDKPLALLSRVLLSHLCGPVQAGAPPHIEPVRRIIRINTLVLPAFSLLVIAVLPPTMNQVFNKDYSGAFDILAIASVIIVIKSFEVVNSMLAIAKNSARTNMYSQAASVAIYLPSLVALVHFGGVFGAAAAIIVRWLVYALFQFFHLRQNGVETVSPFFMLRALAAYACALAFFVDAPWIMVPVYALAAGAFRIWRFDQVARLFAAWRFERAGDK